MGESTRARWRLVNRDSERQEVMVDYIVSYHRDGKEPTRKVFKGAVVAMEPQQELAVSRKLSLAQMSTRRIEPGPHEIEVQVNGEVKAITQFEVVEPG